MTDALVEAGGKAISNAVDPNTGDPIGVTIHTSEGFVYGDGEIEQQLVAVHKTCRAAFTAALQAIEAAGYRVVPVEATNEMLVEGIYAGFWDDSVWDQSPEVRLSHPLDVWSAMLSAAPRVGEGV